MTNAVRGHNVKEASMDVQLIMFNEVGQRKQFYVRKGTTILGRKEDCDIRIPVAEVSRQHAHINLSMDRISLKDLGSSNGTYVNNVRIKEKDLSPGDHVVIGPVVFTVQIDGNPKDIHPVKTKLKPQSAFSAADDLVPKEAREAEVTSKSDNEQHSDDSVALLALDSSGEGSSIAFELEEEIDLGDSDVVEG